MSTGTMPTTQPVRMTIRKRNGKIFNPYRFSKYPDTIEDWKIALEVHIPDIFYTYEPQRITLSDGSTVAQKYILWVSPDDLQKHRDWVAAAPERERQQRIREQIEREQAELRKQYDAQEQRRQLFNSFDLEPAPVESPPRIERPTPRPFVPSRPAVQPKRNHREPPAWMLNMPDVIKDGNGNEYRWNALTTEKPKPQEEQAPVLELRTPPIESEAPKPQPCAKVKRQSTATGHKGVRRCDWEDKRGYNATVAWKGKSKIKFFPDRAYGDRLGAFDAAIQWRNKTEKELGKPRTELLIFGTVRSNTGYQGITQSVKDGRYNVFEVTWLDADGRKHTAQISIDKHGRRGALRKAKQIRLAKWKERIRSNEGKKL